MVSTRRVSRYDAVASVISMQLTFLDGEARCGARRLETGKKCVTYNNTRGMIPRETKINKQKERTKNAPIGARVGRIRRRRCDGMECKIQRWFGLVGFNKPPPPSHSFIPFRRHPHPQRARSPLQASRMTCPHPPNHLSRRDVRDPRLTAR